MENLLRTPRIPAVELLARHQRGESLSAGIRNQDDENDSDPKSLADRIKGREYKNVAKIIIKFEE